MDSSLLSPSVDILDMEFAQLTSPYKYERQRYLVTKHGTLDVLGSLHQCKNGAIDSRDFGKNLHDKEDGQFLNFEKEEALRRLQKQILEALARMISQELRIKTNPKKGKLFIFA